MKMVYISTELISGAAYIFLLGKQFVSTTVNYIKSVLAVFLGVFFYIFFWSLGGVTLDTHRSCNPGMFKY